MEMTEAAICREYRLAKDKRQQIQILMDQNCTDREVIVRILQEGGECIPEDKRKRKTGVKKGAKKKGVKEEYMNGLFLKLEAIETEIKKLEDKRLELENMYRKIVEVIRKDGK